MAAAVVPAVLVAAVAPPSREVGKGARESDRGGKSPSTPGMKPGGRMPGGTECSDKRNRNGIGPP